MGRKAVPEDTQNSVLLKIRRRYCLCFWLSGRDEVVKGQIAHLDHNNENSAVTNLVFPCYEHHDEYDGRTSTSKARNHRPCSHRHAPASGVRSSSQVGAKAAFRIG